MIDEELLLVELDAIELGATIGGEPIKAGDPGFPIPGLPPAPGNPLAPPVPGLPLPPGFSEPLIPERTYIPQGMDPDSPIC